MLALWRALQSFLADAPKRALADAQESRVVRQPDAGSGQHRTTVVALLMSAQDREVLSSISVRERIDVHFAESRVEAWDAANRLNSPLILYDRDWPNAEWRSTVQAFASSPQRSCVILASRVADEYLWQELIRCGGYDLLAKPFRADDVARALQLALAYWNNSRTAAAK